MTETTETWFETEVETGSTLALSLAAHGATGKGYPEWKCLVVLAECECGDGTCLFHAGETVVGTEEFDGWEVWSETGHCPATLPFGLAEVA